jgi:hypothetical protein
MYTYLKEHTMAKTPKKFIQNASKPEPDTNEARTRPGKPDSPRLSAEEIALIEQEAVANDANNRKS